MDATEPYSCFRFLKASIKSWNFPMYGRFPTMGHGLGPGASVVPEGYTKF